MVTIKHSPLIKDKAQWLKLNGLVLESDHRCCTAQGNALDTWGSDNAPSVWYKRPEKAREVNDTSVSILCRCMLMR
jgi:hypothetical protein